MDRQTAKERIEDCYEHIQLLNSNIISILESCLEEDIFAPACICRPFWDCEKSPVGWCVYDHIIDPAHDNCIFCGEPEERK